MSQQFDNIAGFDFSSLASVTQAQLLQAINQAAPLSNIGHLVVMDGLAAEATGVGFPDVASNPRFVRYIWLDTNPSGVTPINRASPVFKRYIGSYTGGPNNPSAPSNLYTDWEALAVADGSITTAMLRDRGAAGGVDVTRLKRNATGTADASKRYFILRIDSAGQYVEIVSLDTAIADGGGIGLNRLNAAAIGPNKFLGATLSGTSYILGYKLLDPTNDISALLGNLIPATSCLAPSTAGKLLRTNRAAIPAIEWVASNGADLFSVGDILLASLAAGGAVVGDLLGHDGTNWVKKTPTVDVVTGPQSYYPGTFLSNATKYIETGALVSCPRFQRAVIVCTTADGSFGVGDELSISGVMWDNGTWYSPAINFFWRASTSKLRLAFYQATQFVVDRFDAGGAPVALVPGSWAPKIYYWL